MKGQILKKFDDGAASGPVVIPFTGAWFGWVRGLRPLLPLWGNSPYYPAKPGEPAQPFQLLFATVQLE